MKAYTLKLKTTDTTEYNLNDGTSLVSDTDLGILFTTAGEAYFVFDFNSLTPSSTTALTILDSNSTAVITNTGLTGIAEDKNFKGTWSASATEFDSFAGLTGVAMDEAQLSTLVGIAKEKGKVLTSADYNWPTSNPNGIAPWLLDAGVYTSNGLKIYIDGSSSASYASIIMIVKTATVASGMGDGVVAFFPARENPFSRDSYLTDGSGSNLRNLSAPTIAQSTGTSPVSVMSQNAVTSMVFADPNTKRRVNIGLSANSSGNSVAIGESARAEADGAVALGRGATVTSKGSIALGYGAHPSAAGQMDIGTGNTNYGYNSSGYRLLTGLYDGQSDHDAVNLSQLNGRVLQNAGAPTTSTVGTVGQLLEDTTNGDLYQCTAVDTESDPAVYTWEEVGAGGGGSSVTALTSADYNYPTNNPTGLAPWLLDPGMYYIDASPMNPITLYSNSSSAASISSKNSLIVNKTTVSGDVTTNVISYGSSDNIWSVDYNASGTRKKEGKLIASNSLASSTGDSTTAVMNQNAVTSMVFADPSTKYKIQVGYNSEASGTQSIAIGGASAYSERATATGIAGVAISNEAKASGDRSIAIKGQAGGANSVAIGIGANASAKGEFAIGSVNNLGYNDSNYRLLTGLYDPQSAHDAATKGYVDGLVGDIESALNTINNGSES